MSAAFTTLGRVLNTNANVGAPFRKDWGAVLTGFLGSSGVASLEPHVVNPGHISLVLQTPEVCAVVVNWDETLTQYGPSHACEAVWSYLVRGTVEVLANSSEESCESLPSGECHHLRGAGSYSFKGTPGSISVHLYSGTVTSYVWPSFLGQKKLVICNELLSVTDKERGDSVAKVFETHFEPQDAQHPVEEACGDEEKRRQEQNQQDAVRLYTNFRDLIELLHTEVEPIEEGEYHRDEHIAKMCGLLGAVRLNEEEYKRYLRFQPGMYTRNLVGYDVTDGTTQPKFTVLILCWAKGQMSPIHDHAGSSCWVKVLKGRVRELRYDVHEGPGGATDLSVRRDITLGAEQVCYINDTQGVHSMGNPDPDQVAVSLHVYAPPYVLCTLFDEAEGTTSVGSMATARIPTNPFSVVDPCAVHHAESPLDLASFHALVAQSLEAGKTGQISSLVERLCFQECEWRQFIHFDKFRYSRSLVSLTSSFSLLVSSWNVSQATPVHDHATSVKAWVKVLRGTMQLKLFSGEPACAAAELVETLTFSEGELIKHELFEGLHVLGNASSEDPAVTLHLFSPPMVHMAYVDSNGVDCVIPVVHSHTATSDADRCCAADPMGACDEVVHRVRAGSMDETKSETSAGSSTIADEFNAQSSLANLLSFFHLPEDRDIFTNMHALVRFVTARDLAYHESSQHVVMALDRMRLHPEEWSAYLEGQGTQEETALVARGRRYKLLLRTWPAGGSPSPPHRMENITFFKALAGSLLVTQSLDGEQLSSSVVTGTSGAFVGSRLECEFENVSQDVCCVCLLLVRQ